SLGVRHFKTVRHPRSVTTLGLGELGLSQLQPFGSYPNLLVGGMQAIHSQPDFELNLLPQVFRSNLLLAELRHAFRPPRISPTTVEYGKDKRDSVGMSWNCVVDARANGAVVGKPGYGRQSRPFGGAVV